MSAPRRAPNREPVERSRVRLSEMVGWCLAVHYLCPSVPFDPPPNLAMFCAKHVLRETRAAGGISVAAGVI